MKALIGKIVSLTLRNLPAVLAFAAIGTVAYVGIKTNWKMPSSSQIFGQQTAVKDDWCGDHGVPESTCVLCNDITIDTLNLPSQHKSPNVMLVDDHGHAHDHDHGEAEKKPTTAPATTQAAVDWCSGHGVPESICTRCNPELIPSFKVKGDWCNGHGLPESQCIQCNPELKEKFEKMAPKAKAQADTDRVIQLSTADIAGKSGIDSQPAQSQAMTAHISVNAEVRYDMNHYAQISPRVSGNVGLVRVEAGQKVKKR